MGETRNSKRTTLILNKEDLSHTVRTISHEGALFSALRLEPKRTSRRVVMLTRTDTTLKQNTDCCPKQFRANEQRRENAQADNRTLWDAAKTTTHVGDTYGAHKRKKIKQAVALIPMAPN